MAPHRLLKYDHVREAQVECLSKSTLRFAGIVVFSVCIVRMCTEEDISVLNFAKIFQLQSYFRDVNIIYCLL